MRGMFFKKYGDIVVGVFFMVLGALLVILAQALPKSKVMEIGPGFHAYGNWFSYLYPGSNPDIFKYQKFQNAWEGAGACGNPGL